MDSTDRAISSLKMGVGFLSLVFHTGFEESVPECFSNDVLEHGFPTYYFFLPGHCLESTE